MTTATRVTVRGCGALPLLLLLLAAAGRAEE
eukprot:COSAG02_NODE_25365_length_660_cov_66.208556_1_plen_30_part_01